MPAAPTVARLLARLLPSADARLWLAYLLLAGASLVEIAVALLRCLRRLRLWVCGDVPVATFSPTPFNTRAAAAVLDAGGGAFRPPALLSGPTVQSVMGVHSGQRGASVWRRELVPVPLPPLAPDAGRAVGLDWWCPDTKCGCSDKPLGAGHVVLLLHGLAGNSTSHAMLTRLAAACAARGWRPVCYVRRGHGGVALGAGFPEHAELADLAAVVADLGARPTTARLSAVGCSAGGNLLVRYLGSHACAGLASPLAAAAAVSSAYDLAEVSRALPWAMDQVLLAGLRRLLRGCLPTACDPMAPGHERARLAATRSHSVRDFDERMHTSAPAAAGVDVDEYYARNSSAHALARVRTPLLCVAALDDPCVLPGQTARAIAAARANPAVVAVTTRGGGHLGWVQERGRESWGVAAVIAFLEAAAAADRRNTEPWR
jgi:predicted alpha/beta-fold hydrolase